MAQTTTRRSLIKATTGIAAIVATSTTAIVSANASPATVPSAAVVNAWNKAISTYEAAAKAALTLGREYDRCEEVSTQSATMHLSRPKEPQLVLPAGRRFEDLPITEIKRLKVDPIEQAAFEKALTAWQRECDARKYPANVVADRWHAALRDEWAAMEDVMRLPAPDVPALLRKLAIFEIALREYEPGELDVSGVLSDVRRFLGGEA